MLNPPFYPKQPADNREHAFFCGPNFEYFQRLYSELKAYLSPRAEVYMILTDDCALDTISDLANKTGFTMVLREKQIFWKEEHLIYQLEF